MSEYMVVLILSIVVPFLLSFWPGLKFYRNIRSLFISVFLIVIIFGSWDIFATYRGHWYFNPRGVWGFRVINLPLEEVLFFVVIPFCCIFTWEAIKYLGGRFK
ncbi:MAG: lycopene cyclase domain-containing protein [Candidatus Omnitrophica bacterium]|nr:lycopene cyclase domain-containing protein [Candidatus Omnitrophota bacterium]